MGGVPSATESHPVLDRNRRGRCGRGGGVPLEPQHGLLERFGVREGGVITLGRHIRPIEALPIGGLFLPGEQSEVWKVKMDMSNILMVTLSSLLAPCHSCLEWMTRSFSPPKLTSEHQPQLQWLAGSSVPQMGWDGGMGCYAWTLGMYAAAELPPFQHWIG